MPTDAPIRSEAIDFVRSFSPGEVDLILTDPPYAMPAHHYPPGNDLYPGRLFADMGIFEYYFRDFFAAAREALNPNTGAIYMFCNHESYPIFYWHGFQTFGKCRCLVWDKEFPGAGLPWCYTHELILFASVKPLKYGGAQGDVIRARRVSVKSRTHPAEKPINLLQVLIQKHLSHAKNKERFLVVDPFAGSGSTMMAARGLGCRACVCDVDPMYFDALIKKYNEKSVQSVLDLEEKK